MNTSVYDCKASYIPIASTGYFSKLINDYLDNNASLKPFFNFNLDDQGLKNAIQSRSNFKTDRTTLVNVLLEQYKGLTISEKVLQNIELLKTDNTFTICSAHQPNIATGYLYFIYKIIHAVTLADYAKKTNPVNNFVPIFFIGSEDNDLEELGHFTFGKKIYNWATTQTGAVGSMQVDEALSQLINELLLVLGPLGINEKQLKSTFKNAYSLGNTIAYATRIIINDLLGFMGVIVLDANDARLKRNFIPIIKSELLQAKAFELVSNTSQQLNENYKVQAFFRPINFFYLKDNIRERIEKVNDQFIVLNTPITFTHEALVEEIENHPERFSPNVILRGMYQESILPNIAFIGGGAEVAYWMQLKASFDYYKVFYPMIVLRQSALILDEPTIVNAQKIGLNKQSMFIKTKNLIDSIISEEKIQNWDLSAYENELINWQSRLVDKYKTLDVNLEKSINAALTKVKYQFDIINKKVNRAIKSKLDIQIDRIYSFKEHAFPNDSLQERYDTFMPYYLEYGAQLFEDLYTYSKPFGNEFLILEYYSKK